MTSILRRLMVLLLVAGLAAILAALGFWQLDRAREKEQLAGLYRERAAGPPLWLTAPLPDGQTINYQRVQLRGVYDPVHQFLLTNQVYRGQLGYHVITPLRLAGPDATVLVNRGWVAHDYNTDNAAGELAPPAGEVEVTGVVTVPRRNPFVREIAADPDVWPLRWVAVDPERFARLTGVAENPVVVLMDPESGPGGFVRDWPAPVLDSSKNRGYAFQWFAMALAVVATYIVLMLRHGRGRPTATGRKNHS